MTAKRGADAVPGPLALLAVTSMNTAAPLNRPKIWQVRVVAFVVQLPSTRPPLVLDQAVVVYPVIGRPPSLVGADHATLTRLRPGVATTPVGALGTVLGTTLTRGVDAVLLPLALVAVTSM